MITGIAYAATAVLLALVAVLGRTSGHEVSLSSETFRYQSGLLKVMFFCSFLPLLVNLALITFAGSSQSIGEMIIQIIFALFFSFILLYWHLYLKKYSVEIFSDKIRINKIFNRKQVILFSSLTRINLLEGGKGEHVLCVLVRDKELVRFSESMEDFQILTDLFKSRAVDMGIPFFYRDCHNQWSR
jgi:hypothetical protein